MSPVGGGLLRITAEHAVASVLVCLPAAAPADVFPAAVCCLSPDAQVRKRKQLVWRGQQQCATGRTEPNMCGSLTCV